MNKKVVFVIMDGWGIAPPDKFNAIANANTPNVDKLIREYANTSLRSDGEAVGLEEGQFGTSEINHLTIGSGRIVMQDLPKINHAIKQGSFYSNPALHKIAEHVKENNSRLHLLGILSDGGVHSNIEHLFAIFDLLDKAKFTQQVYLHLFSDGRDVAPKSVEKYMKLLMQKLATLPDLKVKVATLQGRHLLDRDREWAITEKAFQLIRYAKGNKVAEPHDAINLEYNQNVQDEYFGQYVFDEEGVLREKDGLIIFHYRTDRQYQITKRIFDENLADFKVASFVRSGEEFTDLEVAFPRDHLDQTLAQILAENGKKQLHVTETEKYPHLTYFLNGEREVEFEGEDWVMFESNRMIKPRYAFEPTMRNFDIAKQIMKAVDEDKYDFIIANFSSPDMVGHTGNYNAAVVSAESVDFCMGLLYEKIKEKLDQYVLIITADHGNSDIMWDYENDQPHTQHTLSKVPFIMVSDLDVKLARREGLENVAPTVLDLMGLEKPSVMTGESLLRD